MGSDGSDIRASFSFYPSDNRALQRLTLLLRDKGFDVQRTDTFRLLLHLNTELEMLAHATLRLRQEETQPRSDEMAMERFTVRMPKAWLQKLDRVVDEFTRRDVQMERTYVARSLVYAPYDEKLLCKQAARFMAEFPDRRMRSAKKVRRKVG
jgi:hypothetical protein